MARHRTESNDDLLPEYDMAALLQGAERGKYADAYKRMASVVTLDPDVLKVFPDSQSVNDALRLVIALRKIPPRRRRKT